MSLVQAVIISHMVFCRDLAAGIFFSQDTKTGEAAQDDFCASSHLQIGEEEDRKDGKQQRDRRCASYKSRQSSQTVTKTSWGTKRGRTALEVDHTDDTVGTPAFARQLQVPDLSERSARSDIAEDINQGVHDHEDVDAVEKIFARAAGRVPKQPQEQEADGNLGETAADQDGDPQGEIPPPDLDALLRRQMNGVLAEAVVDLDPVEADGNDAANLFRGD